MNSQNPESSTVAWSEINYCPINGMADAFYSFFVLDERIYSVHRRFNLDIPRMSHTAELYSSVIILSEYSDKDGNLEKLSEEQLTHGEDPRVVSCGINAFIVCFSGSYKTSGNTSSIKVIQLPSRLEYQANLPDNLKPGKNWQPFIKEGILHVIHGFSPFIILKFDGSGAAHIEHYCETELGIPAPHDGYTMFRGGSNGLTLKSGVVGAGHLTTSRHEHRPFIWGISESKRLRVIIPTKTSGFREKGFNVIDPTSLFLWKEKLYFGICASEREWFFGQRFWNLLIQIPAAPITQSTAPLEQAAKLIENSLSSIGARSDIPASITIIPEQLHSDYPLSRTTDGIGSSDAEGCLAYGPYLKIKHERHYVAIVAYSCEHPYGTEEVGVFDISISLEGAVETLAEYRLHGTDRKLSEFEITFSTVGKIGYSLETRIFVNKESSLEIYDIRLAEVPRQVST